MEKPFTGGVEMQTNSNSEQIQYELHHAARLAERSNIGTAERLLSLIAGAGILIVLQRRLFIYLGAAAAAIYLIYRGLAGYCRIYEAIGIDTTTHSFGEAAEKLKETVSDELGDDEEMNAASHPLGSESAADEADEMRGFSEYREGDENEAAQPNLDYSQEEYGHVGESHIGEGASNKIDETLIETFPASDSPATY